MTDEKFWARLADIAVERMGVEREKFDAYRARLEALEHRIRVNQELAQAFGPREGAGDPDEEDTKVRIDPRLIEWVKGLGE